LASWSAFGQTAASKTVTNRTAEQLLRMERDWAKAVVDRNPSVIARIQANDFIGWDFKGKAYTKAENIQALESGYWKTISLDLDDVKAGVVGDTAVVTSRVARKGRFKDQDLTGQFRWTRVYAKRRGC
jgi:ketosteroid isomerase-like protein